MQQNGGRGGEARWAQVQGGGRDHPAPRPQGHRRSLLQCVRSGQEGAVGCALPERRVQLQVLPRPHFLEDEHPSWWALTCWWPGERGASAIFPPAAPGGTWRSQEPGERGEGQAGRGAHKELGSSLTRPQPTGVPQMGLDYCWASATAFPQKAVSWSPPGSPPHAAGNGGPGLGSPPPRGLWQWAVWSSVRGGDRQTDQEETGPCTGWACASHSCPPGGPPSRPTACPSVRGHGPPPGGSWPRLAPGEAPPPSPPCPPRPSASTPGARPPLTSFGVPVALAGHSLWGAIYTLGRNRTGCPSCPRPRLPSPAVGWASPSPASTAPGSCSGLSSPWQRAGPPGLRVLVAPGPRPARSRLGLPLSAGARALPTPLLRESQALAGAPPSRYEESTAAPATRLGSVKGAWTRARRGGHQPVSALQPCRP